MRGTLWGLIYRSNRKPNTQDDPDDERQEQETFDQGGVVHEVNLLRLSTRPVPPALSGLRTSASTPAPL